MNEEIEQRLERLERTFADKWKEDLEARERLEDAVNKLRARILFMEFMGAIAFATNLAVETQEESKNRKCGLLKAWNSVAQNEILKQELEDEQREAEFLDFCSRSAERTLNIVSAFEDLCRRGNSKKAAETK
jgi:negative regulator of genetic competence, sporulation and motility